MLLSLLLACAGTSDPPVIDGEIVFVRGGLVLPGEGQGQPLPGDRRLVARDWKPGESVTMAGITAAAPARAECLPLFSVDLGDVARLVAGGDGTPNTDLAFSPDGSRLAVGTTLGDVVVIDAWSGALLGRRHLAESLLKHVAWAPDSATLYAAEQSPDAFLHAIDPTDLSSRWSIRLADIVESSTPPKGDDVYGIYSLPAAFGLQVLPTGDLIVAALHSWKDEEDRHRNLSQLLRIRPTGEIAARWPEKVADATMKHPIVDVSGSLVAVSVGRSADGPPPTDLPIGGVAVLGLPDLQPRLALANAPLLPWFHDAFIWEALDLSQSADLLFMGFGDGRVRLLHLDGSPRAEPQTGTPIMAGEVPIYASVGYGLVHGSQAIFLTSRTLIPWGAAAPDLRPPGVHPAENTLTAMDANGEVRWSWTGPQNLDGLVRGADGRHLVVGAGARHTDERQDLYGALIFDAGDPAAPDDRSGEARLEAVCPTEGPVFFRPVMSADGRVAVAEFPTLHADGGVSGAYRVTVFR